MCLFTYSGVQHIVCCVFTFLRLVYPLSPVSLDCSFLIAHAIFSNLYFEHYTINRKPQFHFQNSTMFLLWMNHAKRIMVMVFNTTFNNILILAISWLSALLVEETGLPIQNHWPAASDWQTLSDNVVLSTPHHERDLNSQLIGTDWTCSYKSNYHTIKTTTSPYRNRQTILVHCFKM